MKKLQLSVNLLRLRTACNGAIASFFIIIDSESEGSTSIVDLQTYALAISDENFMGMF